MQFAIKPVPHYPPQSYKEPKGGNVFLRHRAGFTKLWAAVKVDLTGRFDKNLVICVSPTFIWLSTWHKFDRPSTLSQMNSTMASIKFLCHQPSTLLRSNRVTLLVVDNGMIDLWFNANSIRNSFSDGNILAYRMTCLQTIGVTMATLNHESRVT